MNLYDAANVQMEDNVRGVFAAATGSAKGLIPQITAGITALDGQSFGNEAALGFKPSVLGL